MARPTRRPPAAELPPHSPESEAAVIGCLLDKTIVPSQAAIDSMLAQLVRGDFYLHANQQVFQICSYLRADGLAVDAITVFQWAKDKGWLDDIGGMEYLARLAEQACGLSMFGTHIRTLKEKSKRRLMLKIASEVSQKAKDQAYEEGALDKDLSEFSEQLAEAKDASRSTRRGLELIGPEDSKKFVLNQEHLLVGDTDFRKGYEGITVIAGPPGSGKSLLSSTLGLAGARGSGTWMGLQVHRQFRTLILGAENGKMRWKRDFAQMEANNPDLDIHAHVRAILPPEGGLGFHRPEFRSEVRRLVREFQPDLVVLDPWTSVAVDDSSKDIIDKLTEIRSCFPAGDDCPALVIVAHTKKPRPEDGGSRGRSLMYSVSGSQALVSTARCVYVLLPYTDEITDHRVLWCCSKLSDGTAASDRVFLRVLGREFPETDDDPETYWDKGRPSDGPWLTPDLVKRMLTAPHADGMIRTFTVNGLAKALADDHNDGRGVSTVHKWLKGPEYAKHLVKVGGFVAWQD